MNPVVIIPSRLSSVRLPKKPLAMMGEKPMVIHVMERAMASGLKNVVVACCCSEIADLVTHHGGRAIQTDPHLTSGTDRIHAALSCLDPDQTFDTVINLQGDLPLFDPTLLCRVLEPLKSYADVDVSTLASCFDNEEEAQNPSCVKIAMSQPDSSDIARAWYFSRQAIPYQAMRYFHHIGIYAYTRSALERFVKLPPSALEKQESLEQLRALEAGMRFYVALADTAPQSVDTASDLQKVQEQYAKGIIN